MSNVVEFPQLVERGCGLDVHQQTVDATVKGLGITEETRTFGTFTCDLQILKAWLKENGISHLAMESTGVYWKPVYNILSEAKVQQPDCPQGKEKSARSGRA